MMLTIFQFLTQPNFRLHGDLRLPVFRFVSYRFHKCHRVIYLSTNTIMFARQVQYGNLLVKYRNQKIKPRRIQPVCAICGNVDATTSRFQNRKTFCFQNCRQVFKFWSFWKFKICLFMTTTTQPKSSHNQGVYPRHGSQCNQQEHN